MDVIVTAKKDMFDPTSPNVLVFDCDIYGESIGSFAMIH